MHNMFFGLVLNCSVMTCGYISSGSYEYCSFFKKRACNGHFKHILW